ncbi:MAG TPA: hypothetical protein VH040_09010, partial [Usitatibacter sp.]|nr:hypothetical protein [Usitatibacter sp.]
MRVLQIIGVLCAFVPALALAYQESLSFRLNSGGDVEAVISGITDYCGLQFVGPSAITRTGNDIEISSPDTEYPCFVAPPFSAYQVVANLGPLDSASTYHVTWSEGPAMLAGQVSPGMLPPASTINYTALWWVSAESGWGININHQDSTIFAVLFSYGGDGTPMWLVAPNMSLLVDGSFSGEVYRVEGGAAFGAPWARVKAVDGVGWMTARFASDQVGTVTVIYDGEALGQAPGTKTLTKTIEKEIFSTPTTCGEGKGSRASLANYQDMWWDPAEPGWGLAIAH